MRIEIYSDAAIRKLLDQISQGSGHNVFQVREGNWAAPLGWNGKKIERVVDSTVAAEALSLQMYISHGISLRAVLATILSVSLNNILIFTHVDSNNITR